jgi:hypothetical protein
MTIIVLFPKEKKAKEFNLERFEPMVNATPVLAERVPLKSPINGDQRMIKEKELTDPTSCMSRARPGEMTFVLLGRDKAAPVAIAAWAAARVALGKNQPGDAQIQEALECALRMIAESGGDGSPPSEFLLLIALSFFMERAHENSVAKGFWPGGTESISAETCGSKIALMHSELSEALEGVRKPGPDAHCPEYTSEEIEMADLLIRAADYCRARRLRIGEAILAKMAFNETRPHLHGKAI